LLGYTGNEKDIILPENYNGEQYKIYKCAFYANENITSVSIPDSITDMDIMAFAYCKNLKNVTIGKGLSEISQAAFLQCTSITSITIPNNIKLIGHRAFANCTNFTSAIFEEANSWCVDKSSLISDNSIEINPQDSTVAAEYLRETYTNYVFIKK